MSTSSRGTVRPTRGRRRSSQAAGDADDPDTSFTGSDPTMPMSSSPTALGGGGGKGKAREVKGYEVDPVMEAEFRSWAEEGAAERSKAYADRMKQALGSSGSTNQQNGPAGDDEDEDEVFVYTGKDVRGSQLFSPPASFKRRAGGKAADEEGEEREMDYAARLDAVLGPSTSTSSKPAEDEDDAFALPAQLVASSAAESSSSPNSPVASPSTLSPGTQRRSALFPPPSRPLSHSRTPSNVLSRSASSNTTHPGGTPDFGSPPPASRPYPTPLGKRPFNPQFSRLRSVTGKGAPLPRSASNTSTLFSQGLVLPGDLRRSQTFGGAGSDIFSRQSSISNLHDVAHFPGGQPSVSLGAAGRPGLRDREASVTPSMIGSDDLVRVNGVGSSTGAAGKDGTTEFGEGIFRWSSLRKITKRLFPPPTSVPKGVTGANGSAGPGPSSGASSSSVLGQPTVVAASGVIVVGTAKGWTTVFDYGSNLKSVLGTEAIVKECGGVTSLAISHDHTFVAVGHALGSIHLYDLAKPALPNRSVPSSTPAAIATGRKEGHLHGSKITHVGFVGARHTAIVSADETGLAFYHSLGKVLGLASTDIVRILGKYPENLGAGTEAAGTPSSRALTAVAGPIAALRSESRSASHLRQASATSENSSRDGSIHDGFTRPGRRKTTTVYGASPLPLGPAPHPTDAHALAALQTPSKLVIVGLKPTPRTWWRAARGTAPTTGPKDATAVNGHADQGPEYAGQTGAVAWFPSSVIKDTADIRGHAHDGGKVNGSGEDGRGKPMDPILAFAWGKTVRFVTVLADGLQPVDDEARLAGLKAPKAASLRFVEGKSWIAEAPVVSVQWLNWRIICLVTTSQLEIVDTQIWQKTGWDPLDLRTLGRIDKERDTVSPPVFGQLPNGADHATSDPGVSVSGAVRAYKGKVFMLTSHDLRLGIIMSWADRVLALVEEGSLVEAIELTTLFWHGRIDAETIGLPSDPAARHALVRPKLREIMAASLDYVFSEDRMRDDTHYDPEGRGVDRTSLFEGLVTACVKACLAVDALEFVFEDVYERYAETGIENIFLEQLEPFILRSEIRSPPTTIVQKLIALYDGRSEYELAERLIWHVDPFCLDINQALGICQRHKLFDALVYIYTKAIGDFVGPMVELLQLIRRVQQHRKERPRRIEGFDEDDDVDYFAGPASSAEEAELEASVPEAYKVFAYLAATLTGLGYPTQTALAPDVADNARKELYQFVFSGHSIHWPPPNGPIVLTEGEGRAEHTHPYLRLLLRFDAEAMLDALDVAFEDSYLNEQASQLAVTRQSIVDVLLDVMDGSSDFTTSDHTFLHIFIARNLPKFPQFISLPGSTLHQILSSLASDTDQSTREDRQLASEFLLSAYSPGGDPRLLELFEQAGFWRILRSIYQGERRWASLIDAYLRDPEADEGAFEHLWSVLRTVAKGDIAERAQVLDVLLAAVPQLVETSVRSTAFLVEAFYPAAHQDLLATLGDAKPRQFAYLRSLLEPDVTDDEELSSTPRPSLPAKLNHSLRMQYLSLLCDYDPFHIVDYLTSTPHTEDSEAIVKICTQQEVFDAVLWELDAGGQSEKAFAFLDQTCESRCDLIVSTVISGEGGEGGDVFGRRTSPAQKYTDQLASLVKACVKTCVARSSSPRTDSGLTAEDGWLRLLLALTTSIHTCASLLPSGTLEEAAGLPRSASTSSVVDLASGQGDAVLAALRSLLSEALSGLISNTTSRQVSFPRLVRNLLDRAPKASAPRSGSRSRASSEFGSVIVMIIDIYRFEGSLLETTNRLLDSDLFEDVGKLERGKRRGWRPDRSGCAYCGKGVWGPGAVNLGGPEETSEDEEKPSIERLGLAKRPSFVRKKSLKGKEVELFDDLSFDGGVGGGRARPVSWQSLRDGVPPNSMWLARGVAVGADGMVYHRSCWETVARSAIGA